MVASGTWRHGLRPGGRHRRQAQSARKDRVGLFHKLPDASQVRLNVLISWWQNHAQIICDRLDVRKRLAQLMS